MRTIRFAMGFAKQSNRATLGNSHRKGGFREPIGI
jgi:hypothetical protein